jgi:MscS family membrane protein
MIAFKMMRRFVGQTASEQFTGLMTRPIAVQVLLITIYFGFATLKFPEELDVTIYDVHLADILHSLIQLVMAISFTWIAMRFIDFIGVVLYERAEKTEGKMDDQLVPFIKDFFKVIVVVFAVFFILSSVFHVNITSLLAGIGIGGLAIALAAQSSLENLLGSVMIFIDKPFTVGDVVDVGGVVGEVEKVGFRSTRIRTFDKSYVTLPNKMVADSITDNLTLRTFRRVRFMVGLTYETNQQQIEAIVKDIKALLDEHQNTNEEGSVGFHEFGDSSLNVLVQYYADHDNWEAYMRVREDINFRIMEIVNRHGSDFAFPSRTVYMEKS